MPPVKPVESAVIPVGGDPSAAGFNRDGRQERVRNEITAAARFSHEPGEDRPMARPGTDQDRFRGFANGLHESKCQLRVGGWIEYSWMGYNSQKTAKHQIRHAEGFGPTE